MVSWLGYQHCLVNLYPVTMKGLVCPFLEEWPLELARSVLTVRHARKLVGDAGILLPPDDLERWFPLWNRWWLNRKGGISLRRKLLKRSTSFQLGTKYYARFES